MTMFDEAPAIWAGKHKAGQPGSHVIARPRKRKAGEHLICNMRPCKTKLGFRLRELRLAAGLNTKEVTRLLNRVSTGAVSDHELGKRIPTLETLIRYAEIYNTTVSKMLEGIA